MVTRTYREGDVFSVQLDEKRVGYGQIVGRYGESEYYFAFFERAYAKSHAPVLSDIARDRIVLLGLSFDAKLWSGDWQVVGNVPVAPAIPLPAYKVGKAITQADEVVYDAEDYTGQQHRPATREEVEALPFRKAVAPIRLERAFRAIHGIGAWERPFDDLRPTPAALSTQRLFRN